MVPSPARPQRGLPAPTPGRSVSLLSERELNNEELFVCRIGLCGKLCRMMSARAARRSHSGRGSSCCASLIEGDCERDTDHDFELCAKCRSREKASALGAFTSSRPAAY